MVLFLDSGFFLGLLHPKDPNGKRAKEIFLEISTGKYGLVFSSPYIISETANLILVRTRNDEKLLKDFYDLLYGETRFISILDWTKEIEKETWVRFFSHNKGVKEKRKMLSFVDASNIVYCEKFNISNIVAFDGDFDGYLVRIK